jgi:predicted GIY-YIG superfamily endonuclease
VALLDAIKSYGSKNFRVFVLEKCDDRIIASEREKYWIKKAKEKWKDRKCLNLTDGGENAFLRDPSVQAIINEKLKKHYSTSEAKERCREHAKKTLIKYIKEHGPWNKHLGRKYVPRENGNKGSNNYGAKLSEKQVLEIRELFNVDAKPMYKDVASLYNMSYQVISSIVKRTSWRHI